MRSIIRWLMPASAATRGRIAERASAEPPMSMRPPPPRQGVDDRTIRARGDGPKVSPSSRIKRAEIQGVCGSKNSTTTPVGPRRRFMSAKLSRV